MRRMINTRLFETLKATDKPFDVRDTKLTGFLIRVHPTGNMSYVCEYGRGKRLNIGKTTFLSPGQARDRAKEILGNAAKGVAPTSKKKSCQSEKMTCKNFIQTHYTPWALAHLKSSEKTLQRIKSCFFNDFSNKLLTELTPFLIERWRTARLKKGRSPNTVNIDVPTKLFFNPSPF